jgi:hypothetical protein
MLESRTISKLRVSGLLSESRSIALSSAADELIFRSSGLRRLPCQATLRNLGPKGTARFERILAGLQRLLILLGSYDVQSGFP